MSATSNDNIPNPLWYGLFWPLILLALLPWVILHAAMYINLDTAWLMTAAQRMIGGDHLANNIYEPNPPLAVILHLPPALISRYFQIPPYYSAFCYFSTLLVLSVAVTRTITSRWRFLSRADINVITAALLIASTVLSTTDFGERDQVILLGLLPFILGQVALTNNWPFPDKLRWPVFLSGALLVLLKPPLGLFPTLMIIHRMIKKRQFFAVLKQPDFIALASMTTGYIILCLVAFPDYVHIILPDFIDLYLGGKSFKALIHSIEFAGAITAALILLRLTPVSPEPKSLLYVLLCASLACTISFLVQMMNLYYHLLPAIGFGLIGFALLAQRLMSKYVPTERSQYAVIALTLVIAYTTFPLNFAYPTHSEYKKLELTRLISECDECESFFMFTREMEALHPAIIYSGKTFASRFPVYWFLPRILEYQDKAPGNKHAQDLIGKYSEMTAADFERYKPELVIIEQFKILKRKDTPFDFIGFFSQNESFRKEWQYYRFDQTLTIDRRQYFPNVPSRKDKTLTFDIYRRTEN